MKENHQANPRLGGGSQVAEQNEVFNKVFVGKIIRLREEANGRQVSALMDDIIHGVVLTEQEAE